MKYSLVFLLLTVSVSSAAFSCGSNKFQNWITNLFVKLDCKSRVGQFDSCCRTHDRCYDRKGGRAACDSAFCSCLDRAAGNSMCKTDAKAFCWAVKKFGGGAYNG